MKTNEHKYYLGKCDGYGNGRKTCEAYITWNLDEEKGTFSAQAEIWNSMKTDIIMGGQCLEEVCAFFEQDKKAQSILKIWHEWHLNDMTSGSPAQEAFLKNNPEDWRELGFKSHYDYALIKLEQNGLNPDPSYLHNEKPYEYGTAWLKTELPKQVVAEIKSWSEQS